MEVATARLAQARAALVEEQAHALQAQSEWRQFDRPGEPHALALREPQVASAEAGVRLAQAEVAGAKRDLERTRIVAPYAGRVLEQSVDTGQYVSVGTVLAHVFAVDVVEVRLPLGPRQIEWIDVPERYRRDGAEHRRDGPAVRLTARHGARRHVWPGRIVRAEGSIDAATRQQFVVAQIDDPYERGPADRPPLKIGQFVEAEIEGRMLRDVVMIPHGTLHREDTVFVVDAASRLERRRVEVVWRDAGHAVVVAGLEPGEHLVTTRLPLATSGVLVRVSSIDGEPAADTVPRGGDSAGAPAPTKPTP